MLDTFRDQKVKDCTCWIHSDILTDISPGADG